MRAAGAFTREVGIRWRVLLQQLRLRRSWLWSRDRPDFAYVCGCRGSVWIRTSGEHSVRSLSL